MDGALPLLRTNRVARSERRFSMNSKQPSIFCVENPLMFTADSRTENFLTALGVQYEYVNGILLTADFAPGWNTENIGRPVAIREDAVIEYASLMEAGSAAPAPILHRNDNGQLRVLDGVQRLSAAELNQSTRISAYVVTTTSEDSLASIRVLANARMQGRAEPAEWTRRRAVEVLVVQRGMSAAEVARMGGWRASDIAKLADAIELQSRITNAGGPELPDLMLAELRQHIQLAGIIDKATEPVVGFLNTLKQSRISVSDAAPYIEDFFRPLPKNSVPFREFSERLNDVHEDPEIRARLTGRQSSELPKDVVLLRTLKSAETTLEHILTHGERVANVDEFFRILDRLTKQLKSVAPNKQPKQVRVPADMWSDK